MNLSKCSPSMCNSFCRDDKCIIHIVNIFYSSSSKMKSILYIFVTPTLGNDLKLDVIKKAAYLRNHTRTFSMLNEVSSMFK